MVNKMLTTAQEKLERIKLGIESGKTVYLTTYLKFWKYTPKIVKRIEAFPFKVSGNSLYVQQGKHWLCADGCGIVIRQE